MRGAYFLLIYVPEKIKGLRIGALGQPEFRKGYYVYVGSAMGGPGSPVSLEKRVRRHIDTAFGHGKVKRWHIDYLLAHANVYPVRIYLIPSPFKEECYWSNYLAEISEGNIGGFGCSDCGCISHLYYFREDPFRKSEDGEVIT